MKSSKAWSSSGIRYALALGLGILQAASFPKIDLAPLAWLVPGGLMFLAMDRPGLNAFRIGYYAGLSHYLISLYWLLLIPLPIHAFAAWLSVSAVLALYPGAWTCFCSWILLSDEKQGPASRQTSARSSDKPAGVAPAAKEWPEFFWPLICACGWVAMEMGIARILTGFPWDLLGASQYKFIPLIQIASITGVYGISFLVVWVSVTGAFVAFRDRTLSGFSPAFLAELALPLIVLAAVLGFGLHRLAKMEPVERELRIALVQPNIPQLVIWDEKEKTNRFHTLLALSDQAVAAHPHLLVWPEAALPNLLTRFNPLTYSAVTNLVTPNRLWMILGADDAELKNSAANPADVIFFNSAFLVEPSGKLVARYHKQRLVMFGEYMPLSSWLPFLKYLRAVNGGFTPGDRPVLFELTGLKVRTSVLICFEDIFPHLARKSAVSGVDFLLNLTNDGWFRESAAQWQHAVSALFRAVENGLPLVRCTNNGLTCWIDPRGRMHEVYFLGSRDIYGPGIKIARVPLRASDARGPLTFYSRHGDFFGWTCVGLSALAIVRRTFLTLGVRPRPPAERLPKRSAFA